MFGSSILDAAVGLIAIYLILSLVASAVQELIAAGWKWRAASLGDAIRELLNDAAEHADVSVAKLYAHPLVFGLSQGNTRPSYIPSRTFALALLDLIQPVDPPQPRTVAEVRAAIARLPAGLRRSLTILLDEAGNDLEKFKTALEVWFNATMDRASGWYKRRAQVLLLWIAAGLVILMNADTLTLSRALMHDTELRKSMTAQAEKIITQPTGDGKLPADTAQAVIAERLAVIDALNLPVGWRSVAWTGASWQETFALWFTRLCGWSVTVFAISLGAPFWFDVLNRFMNIRGTGKAPEEKPKEPKEQPHSAAPGGLPAMAAALAAGRSTAAEAESAAAPAPGS